MFDKMDPYYDDDEIVFDPNDYTLPQYIRAHIFWGLIFAFIYRSLLFRRVPDCDGVCSVLILAGIVIVACMIGIFFQYKEDRNFLWIMGKLIIGFGIYTVISYISIYTTFMVTGLIISGGIVILNALIILMKRIKNK